MHNPDSLWHFALEVYATPNIEDFCLFAQEELGVSPLLLLWAAWLEVRGCGVTDSHLARVCRQLDSTRKMHLQPIRDLRRFFKAASDLPEAVSADVRSHLLKAELSVEKMMLEKLEAEASDLSTRTKAPALDQLSRYCRVSHQPKFIGGLAQLRSAAAQAI